MISLPASVKVGYVDYQLVLWESIEATAASRKGECCNLTSVIRVRADMAPRSFAETLIHEILHACFYVFDIRDDDKEEKTVSVLSVALATVWRDNPSVVAFIMGALA